MKFPFGMAYITFPKTHIFAEKWWLEDDPFLLGPLGLFSGSNLLLVSGFGEALQGLGP